MNTFLFSIALGFLKALAHSGNLTYDYMVECIGNKEDFELFKSKIEYKTEEKNGILYVTDFNEIK